MISALALIVTIITFGIKLYKDEQVSAYRETIAYMDRHAEKLDEYWDAIKSSSANEKIIKLFLNRLEQMAMLVNKSAFDNDLVYGSYWELYSEPLKYPSVLKFYENCRTQDIHIFSEYKVLSEKWASKIKREQSNQT